MIYSVRKNYAASGLGLVISLAIVLVISLFSSGCAHKVDQAALGMEKALIAGSAAVDAFVEEEIERCRAKKLDEAGRAKCIAPAEKTSEATEKAMKWAVEGLRIYWTARAQGSTAGMIDGINKVKEAATMLPGDFFKGLKGLR